MKGKTALITGASSGFGEACAHRLGESGARLVLIARRGDKLQAVVDALLKKGVDVISAAIDVRDKASVDSFIQQLPHPIDILINNAGCAIGLDPLATAQSEDSDTMIDTNIKGLLYFTQAVLPEMLKRKTGHIVNIGSLAAHNVYASGAVYCATKHAVKAISKSLALEVAGTGVRVTEIDPGAAETEFSLVRFKGNAERAKNVYAKIPQPLTAQDVADAVVYALSCPAHVNIAQIQLYSVDQTERLPS